MLRDLPEDLRARGWEFIRRESRSRQTMDATWHIAVYVRPYEPGVDDDRFTGAIQRGHVRVSTNQAKSASWADAHRDAVEHMRFIDAKRKT